MARAMGKRYRRSGERVQEQQTSNFRRWEDDGAVAVDATDVSNEQLRSGSLAELGFVASPSRLVIPPHEHCYVSVTFQPSTLQTYKARFDAIVENGVDAKSSRLHLTFETSPSTDPKLAASLLRPTIAS